MFGKVAKMMFATAAVNVAVNSGSVEALRIKVEADQALVKRTGNQRLFGVAT